MKASTYIGEMLQEYSSESVGDPVFEGRSIDHDDLLHGGVDVLEE